jgi:phage terminase small subunit
VPKTKKPLTDKQETMVREYTTFGGKGFNNKTMAAILAGYKETYVNCNLVKIYNDKVMQAVEKRQAKLEKKSQVTTEKIVKKLASIAELDKDKNETSNVKDSDKLKACELLGKWKQIGMFDEGSQLHGLTVIINKQAKNKVIDCKVGE